MRKLNAVSMHVSTGFVTIFPACYRKKVSLLPVENLRSFCTWPLWQRSGEGALPLPLTLPCLSTTEKMPRHCPTPRERHAEHPGHEPANQTQNVPTQKMPATQHDRKTDLLFGSPRFSLCWAGCEPRNNLGCSGRRSSRVTEDDWWGTIKILQCHHHKKISEQSLGYGTDHSKLVSNTFLLA